MTKQNRREFLGKTTDGLLAGAAVVSVAGSTSANPTLQDESLFEPESFWAEQMKAPDDGKAYGWRRPTRISKVIITNAMPTVA